MPRESYKKQKPTQYKTPQSLYHVNSNAPDNLLDTLNIELDEDQLTYLKAHMFTLTAQDKHGVAVKEITCINPRKEDGSQTYQQDRVYDTDGVMTTLSAELAGRFNISQGYRIRKLTPLECFRLQSYPDHWYYKLKEHGISDSQLYKMAGNGVTSVVAYEIGKRLIG